MCSVWQLRVWGDEAYLRSCALPSADASRVPRTQMFYQQMLGMGRVSTAPPPPPHRRPTNRRTAAPHRPFCDAYPASSKPHPYAGTVRCEALPPTSAPPPPRASRARAQEETHRLIGLMERGSSGDRSRASLCGWMSVLLRHMRGCQAKMLTGRQCGAGDLTRGKASASASASAAVGDGREVAVDDVDAVAAEMLRNASDAMPDVCCATSHTHTHTHTGTRTHARTLDCLSLSRSLSSFTSHRLLSLPPPLPPTAHSCAQAFKFVGIVEEWSSSVCLLHLQLRSRRPPSPYEFTNSRPRDERSPTAGWEHWALERIDLPSEAEACGACAASSDDAHTHTHTRRRTRTRTRRRTAKRPLETRRTPSPPRRPLACVRVSL